MRASHIQATHNQDTVLIPTRFYDLIRRPCSFVCSLQTLFVLCANCLVFCYRKSSHIYYIVHGEDKKDHAVIGKFSFPVTAWSILRVPFSILLYTKKGVYPTMFNKLCVAFLSICIASAIAFSVTASYSSDTDQDAVTMCIMDYEEVSC